MSPMTQTAAPAITYRHRVPASDNPRGEAFASLIREARRQRGWTQDKLVEVSGVSRSTILRWEAGDASRPDPDQVRAACRALGVDPRRAAVALGYLSPEEADPPGEPRKLTPEEEEVVSILQDPGVPSAKKAEWVDYLRFLRDQRGRGRSQAG